MTVIRNLHEAIQLGHHSVPLNNIKNIIQIIFRAQSNPYLDEDPKELHTRIKKKQLQKSDLKMTYRTINQNPYLYSTLLPS